MTRDEIVTALRCCAKGLLSECPNCKMCDEANCIVKLKTSAADLIENQQRHIEALMKANDSLKDAIARRDKQIAVRCRDCKQGEVDDPDFPDQYYCHAGCGRKMEAVLDATLQSTNAEWMTKITLPPPLLMFWARC